MNGGRFVVVSFWTPEYERFAGEMASRVERLGGSLAGRCRASKGNWEDNCGQKPRAILEALEGIGAQWALYLDVDTLLEESPWAPGGDWDVGLVDNPVPHHRNRVTAAAIFLRNTPGCRVWLRHWAELCERQRGIDHRKMTRTTEVLRETGRVRFADATGWVEWTVNGLDEGKKHWKREVSA